MVLQRGPRTTEKDQNGNIVQTVGYYYLHEVSPNAAEYLSRYIRNRLTSVQVDGGGETYWPMSASYDTATITTFEMPPTIQLHDTANYPASMKYRGNATSVRKGNATTGISIIDVTGGVRSSGGPGGKMEVQPKPVTYYPELYGTVLPTDDGSVSDGGPVSGFGWGRGAGSWNRYAYVEEDPVNLVDTRGLDFCPAEFSGEIYLEGLLFSDPGGGQCIYQAMFIGVAGVPGLQVCGQQTSLQHGLKVYYQAPARPDCGNNRPRQGRYTFFHSGDGKAPQGCDLSAAASADWRGGKRRSGTSLPEAIVKL